MNFLGMLESLDGFHKFAKGTLLINCCCQKVGKTRERHKTLSS